MIRQWYVHFLGGVLLGVHFIFSISLESLRTATWARVMVATLFFVDRPTIIARLVRYRAIICAIEFSHLPVFWAFTAATGSGLCVVRRLLLQKPIFSRRGVLRELIFSISLETLRTATWAQGVTADIPFFVDRPVIIAKDAHCTAVICLIESSHLSVFCT